MTLSAVLPMAEAKVSTFWDASKNSEVAPGYRAKAGPVWNTPNNDPLDLGQTPPDFYRVSVEEKTAKGWKTLIEKNLPLSEVDWPKLKNTKTEKIIRYHEPTRRVAFFLKGDYATLVQALPSPALTATTPSDSISSPESAPASPPAVIEKTPVTESPAADLAKAKRFIPSTVFYVEKGKREYKTKRWATRPRLEIIGQDKALADSANALHATIFDAAGPLPAGEGKITVYIGPAKELAPIRSKLLPDANNDSWSYWTNWNAKREFTQATIFILTDRMNDQEARHALARCFMSASGFPDDSKEYKESLLNPDNQSAELSLIDKRAISFLYRHTSPGIGRESLLTQLTRHWQ